MDSEDRYCPVCGARVVGRSDKKFCSDMCRTDYHNALTRESERQVRAVYRILKNNRKILERNWNIGVKKISMSRLSRQNFDFNVFSSKKYSLLRGRVFRCMDFSYWITPVGVVHIMETGFKNNDYL